jgi:hypothetical protein
MRPVERINARFSLPSLASARLRSERRPLRCDRRTSVDPMSGQVWIPLARWPRACALPPQVENDARASERDDGGIDRRTAFDNTVGVLGTNFTALVEDTIPQFAVRTPTGAALRSKLR